MQIISIILLIIFTLIAVLHLYWTLGGQKWLAGSLPMNDEGEPLFIPGPLMTAVVVIGLSGFGLYYGARAGLLDFPFSHQENGIIGWVIPSIFFVRGIGDLKYCGVMKKIKGSKFADLDSKIYTPLCFLIAIMGYAVNII